LLRGYSLIFSNVDLLNVGWLVFRRNVRQLAPKFQPITILAGGQPHILGQTRASRVIVNKLNPT